MPTCIYFITRCVQHLITLTCFTVLTCSRVTLLAYSLGRTVLLSRYHIICREIYNWHSLSALATAVGDCAELQRVLNGILVASVCSTTFLFYMRVCAVFCMDRYICSLFGFTWLATVAMSGTFPKTFKAERIGPTEYCLETANQQFLGPTIIVLLVNDVLIFIAVTYKVYKMFIESSATLGQRVNKLILGTSMPILWKVLLQDSQIYCL